jgi:DNA-binding response OmpR family regulator
VTSRVALYENDPALEPLLEDILSIKQLDVVRCSTLAEIHSAVDSGDIDVVVADTWGPANRVLGESERAEIIALGRRVPLLLITARWWAMGLPPGHFGTVVVIEKPMELDQLLDEVTAAIQRGHDDPIISFARARARQLLEHAPADALAVAVFTPGS